MIADSSPDITYFGLILASFGNGGFNIRSKENNPWAGMPHRMSA